jgi:hypothetical protein
MPFTLPGGLPASVLDPGFNYTLATGIAAAQTLAQAGAALGASNPIFTVQPTGIGGRRFLSLHARGAGAVPTTVTVGLYSSTDGGATWNLYKAAITLVTGTAATDSQVQDLVAGPLYQVLVTTLTLGSASAVSIDGSVS